MFNATLNPKSLVMMTQLAAKMVLPIYIISIIHIQD